MLTTVGTQEWPSFSLQGPPGLPGPPGPPGPPGAVINIKGVSWGVGGTFVGSGEWAPDWPQLESGVLMASHLLSFPTGCLPNTNPATLQNASK